MAADGRIVVAVWSAALAEGQTDIYASVSRDSGARFGAPVRVNATDGDVRVNGEQAPRVVLTRSSRGEPRIAVIWTSAGKAGTTLLAARSDDGGRTFGASSIVPGSDAAGSRGWQSAVADPGGGIHALWLDHRAMAAPAGSTPGTHVHGTAAAASDGFAMAQRSALYTSVVGQPGSVRAITTGVCYCCKTAIVTAADGTIFAAWRNVYAGGIRDIAASVSRDGGRTFAAPVKVSDDGWVLNGCPDDGPAMAIDGRGQLHIVWPTLVTGANGSQTLGLFYAVSKDGRTFTPRQRVPANGVPHHPQIAVAADGRVVIAWDESGKGLRQIALARASSDPSGGVELTRLPASAQGTYPVVVATADGLVAAWTSGTGTDTKIQVARIGPQ
jgi:hypothetical protein